MKTMLVLIVGALIVGVWLLSAQRTRRAMAEDKNTSLNASVDPMKLKQATFAAGCFWGVEVAFRRVDGVVSTQVGYTGGTLKNPTYRQVCNGDTGHAEAVLVTYDPAKVSFPELLDAFWSCHDPTTVDRQGPDYGSQYRSAIFFHDAEQEQQAKASIDEVNTSKVFDDEIVTEVTVASTFYPAEDYHQQYFDKQGSSANCHVGVADVHTNLAAHAAEHRKVGTAHSATQPSVGSCDVNNPNAACGTGYWKELTEAEMKARLTPEQYAIARKAGTERAFTGKYWDEHRAGTYKCAVCGLELFDSETKFESGTGWPSFWQPISATAVKEITDDSHGMIRTEVQCARCSSHLGHVFDDGPEPTGQRYCMNSAVLDLQLKPETAAAGVDKDH